MEVSELMQKVFSKPTPKATGFPGMADALGGVVVPPQPTKGSAFDPQIIQFAQSVYSSTNPPQGGQNGGQGGSSTPKNGTVGGMIPPGWSSQSAK